MKKIFILIALITGLIANEFDEAVVDYNKGNYIKALNTFYALAKKDDAKSQYNVAFIYQNGLGVQKDLVEAKKWYEKAAILKNGTAQYNLAQLYDNADIEDTQSYEKAKHWYKKSIDSGIIKAYNNLGRLYLECPEEKKDEHKALALFNKGAQKGDSSALVNMAVLYAWGEKIPHNRIKAYEYLRKVVVLGKKEARPYLDKLCKESIWACKN